MDKADVDRAVRKALPECDFGVFAVTQEVDGAFRVDLDGSFALTLCALREMSDSLGTDLIEINHMERDGDYSGWICLRVRPQQKGIDR